MGHIDHGKSTLLDYIRKTNVTGSEAGGITQHISSYEVIHKNKEGVERKITFLDTPGHQAFKAMRSRGARVADVAILIVSAEDGVKEQTLEALAAIKDAGVPFIVAINKIDKPQANVDKTKASLVEHEIYLEGSGGGIPWVAISAKAGTGVSDLLDLLLLAADLEELTGDRAKLAEGIVIESHIDAKKGVSATLIIKDGTLKNGMYVSAEGAIAPVRIMEDFLGKKIKEAHFSSPVRIVGFSDTPRVGAHFMSCARKQDAEHAVQEYKENTRKQKTKMGEGGTTTEEEESMTLIPIVIKTDVLGTVEAIKHEIEKIPVPKNTRVRVILEGSGTISESDVKAAHGKHRAIILGFNVGVDPIAKDNAERAGIEIKTGNIIYDLATWLASAIKERIPKVETLDVVGRVKILKHFSTTRNKQVLGGRLETGRIALKDRVRIMRRDEKVGEGTITSLQSHKAPVKEINAPQEFGTEIESKSDITPGDIVESITVTLQ